MSKYKVGDKVVLTVTSKVEDPGYLYYILNDDAVLLETTMNEDVEPLSTYTEPLEDIIQKYTVKIARLVMEKEELKDENERLKAENEKMSIKIDAYELCGDQHKEEYNQAFNQGAEEAWELAKKIILYDKSSYSGEELKEIFGYAYSQTLMRNHTYSEAAAKVAEWEKAKEEIKVGDVVESNNGNGERIAVIDVWSSFDGLHFEGISSNGTLTIDASAKYYTKTGRHIDIGSFLKQIGDEE